jgi:type II secretory pathway pseudopilin PulG
MTSVCRRGRRAFTLVEILIVILVLMIGAAIVIPSIGSAADSQATSAARVLQGDLEVARSLAMTTQQPYSVVFSADLQSYKVVVNYSGVDYTQVVAVSHPVHKGQLFQTTLRNLNGMDSVRVIAVNFGGQKYVTFLSLGDPNTGGSVTLQAGNVVMALSVEALTGVITTIRTAG